jgi:ribosomal protein L3
MAGRMGNEIVTVKNLMIVAVDEATKSLWVAGPVPGHTSGLVTLTITDKVVKMDDLKYLKGYNPVAPVVETVQEEVAQ